MPAGLQRNERYSCCSRMEKRSLVGQGSGASDSVAEGKATRSKVKRRRDWPGTSLIVRGPR